jgi:argininosuccinate synthase
MTGRIRLRLHQGNCIVDGSRSPFGLYDERLATYGRDDRFKHDAAEGFIHLWGLPLELGARVQRDALVSTP